MDNSSQLNSGRPQDSKSDRSPSADPKTSANDISDLYDRGSNQSTHQMNPSSSTLNDPFGASMAFAPNVPITIPNTSNHPQNSSEMSTNSDFYSFHQTALPKNDIGEDIYDIKPLHRLSETPSFNGSMSTNAESAFSDYRRHSFPSQSSSSDYHKSFVGGVAPKHSDRRASAAPSTTPRWKLYGEDPDDDDYENDSDDEELRVVEGSAKWVLHDTLRVKHEVHHAVTDSFREVRHSRFFPSITHSHMIRLPNDGLNDFY
jgi:hypothetical protein